MSDRLSDRPRSAPHAAVAADFIRSHPFVTKYAGSGGLTSRAYSFGSKVVRLSGTTYAGRLFETYEAAAWADFASRIADGRVVRVDGFPASYPCHTVGRGVEALAAFLHAHAPAGAVFYAHTQTRDALTPPPHNHNGPRGSSIYRSPDGHRFERATGQGYSGEVEGWSPFDGTRDRPTAAQFAARVVTHLYAVEPLRA